jgi:hypothetical protein
MSVRAGLLVLAALAACAGPASSDGATHGTPASCSLAVAPQPLANIGPDVTLRVPCGGTTSGAIASVGELAGGLLQWSAAIAGDPSFTLATTQFSSCATMPPAVALVQFAPPVSAKLGDAFDAVVTITAAGEAFPRGTVKVHGEIVPPTIIVAPHVVDFGDVPVGTKPSATIVFHNPTSVTLLIIPPPDAPPFTYDRLAVGVTPGSIASRDVVLDALAEGDDSTVATWTLMPRPDLDLPVSCAGTASVSAHAHVVASPDAGGDARDAGADAVHAPADAGVDEAPAETGDDAPTRAQD